MRTSNDAMAPVSTPDGAKAARALNAALRHARRLAGRAGGRLLLTFVAIAACLWVFGSLASSVLSGEVFALDEVLLDLAHASATPIGDDVFIAVSAMGYAWGVIPADIGLILWLAVGRRFRNATFALFAIGGSAVLNVAVKQSVRRTRPAFRDSGATELTYSFPSAHAMGSATLATVVVLLAWRTPYRWPVVIAAGALVGAVGLGRVYLGVHYPSDVIAGWAAGVAWCLAVDSVVGPSRSPPGPSGRGR